MSRQKYLQMVVTLAVLSMPFSAMLLSVLKPVQIIRTSNSESRRK